MTCRKTQLKEGSSVGYSVSLNLVLFSVATHCAPENEQFIYDDFICFGFSHDNPKVKCILSLRNVSWKLVPEFLFPFSFLSIKILAILSIPSSQTLLRSNFARIINILYVDFL